MSKTTKQTLLGSGAIVAVLAIIGSAASGSTDTTKATDQAPAAKVAQAPAKCAPTACTKAPTKPKTKARKAEPRVGAADRAQQARFRANERHERAVQRVIDANRDFGAFVTDVDIKANGTTAMAFTIWDSSAAHLARLAAREVANVILDAGQGISTVEIWGLDGTKLATFG